MSTGCLCVGGAYQNFAGPEDGKIGDRLVVTPHNAWDLLPSRRVSLGNGGVYLKAKLGPKKAKTLAVRGVRPTWDTKLTLPYDGEQLLDLCMCRKLRGRPNEVLGISKVVLRDLPVGQFCTDMKLEHPTDGPAGFIRLSLRLESADGNPLAAPIPRGSGNSPLPRVQAEAKGAPGTDASRMSADERRALALSAAEMRREVSESRGIGDQERARELMQRKQREEYVGRITEWHCRHSQDPPIGLQLASLEQLQAMWAKLQNQERELPRDV